MATPFLVGCGVAAGCMALRGALHVAQRVKMPNMPNMAGAQAPNLDAARVAAAKVFQDSFARLTTKHPGGFEKQMSRREAAMILGIKCDSPVTKSRYASHCSPRPCRENAAKNDVKEAHRKMMLLNHPDKGGSPFVASKINEALDTMSNRTRRSSAF